MKEGESESESAGSGQDSCAPFKKLKETMFSTPARKPVGSNSLIAKTPVGTGRRFGFGLMGPPSSTRTFSQTPRRPNTAGSGNGNGNVIREMDPIQVYCRVKPLPQEMEGQGCTQIKNDTEVGLIPPDNPAYWRQNQAKEMLYTFSKVFDDIASQNMVFSEVAMPLVEDVLQGKNALMFAYGVTGSGKTYTMCGTPTECGIMPRCLDVIFNSVEAHKATKFTFKPDRMNGFESQSRAAAMVERQRELFERAKAMGMGTPKTRSRNGIHDIDNFAHRQRDETVIPVKDKDCFFSVFITYIEIYKNCVYDLLDDTPIGLGKNGIPTVQSKMLREDSNHNVYVHTVTEVEVESPVEAFEVFQKGLRRRKMAHTALNTESSRSHSIFNIRLVRAPADREGEEVSDKKEHILVSQLSLVDLAGSERYSRTQATGDRLKEAADINSSLMTLRMCMDILRENQMKGTKTVVPFRDSKLTHFLKSYFDGEGRIRMLLCVNPRPEDYDENIHVLSFAEQAQEVQIKRAPEKKIDFQTPGRVKANELYKETVRQMVAENTVVEGQLPRTNTEFVFHNIPLPICHITKSNEGEVLATLRKALELRVKGLDENKKFMQEKQEEFRRELYDMEREYQDIKHENNSMKVKLQMLAEEKTRNESVLRQMLHEKSELEARCETRDKMVRDMEEQIADLQMQLRQRDVQHYKEKQILKSDMDIQRELDDLKRQRVLQREGQKLKAEFKQKEKTLAAVKQLVSGVDVDARTTRSSRARRSKSTGLLDETATSTSSEPDLVPAERSSRAKSTRSRTPSVPLLPIENALGSGSQTRKGIVGVPIARRPRARSTDQDVWLEHTAGIVVKEATVFQPHMKNRKSVTKLTKADDIAAKASKYCLRTQEQDSEGEVETKLYKGDVLPTMGGGAQIIFNDVEVLRQESPTGVSPSTRKRRSSGLLGIVSSSPFRNRSTHYDENPEDLGDRCRAGVGSSSLINKRSRAT